MDIQSPMLTGGTFLAMGLVFAFFGYRLMRSMIRIQSALIFAIVGLSVATEGGWAPLAILGATLGLGVLGYFLGDLLYYVDVFLTGAFVGLAIAVVVMLLGGGEIEISGALAGAGLGLVVGGVLAIIFERPMGILLFSLAGSVLVSLGSSILITGHTVKDVDGILQGVFLAMIGIFAVAGCVVQKGNTKNLPARGSDEEETKTVAKAAGSR